MIFTPQLMYCDTTTCPQGYTCNPQNCLCIYNEITTGGGDGDGDIIVDGGGDGQITDGDGQTGCPDGDQDGVCDDQDNCKQTLNHSQLDEDNDGVGSACDSTPFNCSQKFQSLSGIGQFKGGAQTMGQDVKTWCAGVVGQQEAATCTTLCTYIKTATQKYTAGGQLVNEYSCCFMAQKSLPCSDCPGERPQCPDQAACSQYNPFPVG